MSDSPEKRKVVIFGAGAAGKGLIGLLFSDAGYELTFVDIDRDLVQALRDAGRYEARIHDLGGGSETRVVEGFRVHDAADRGAVSDRIAEADLVMTAVFAQNLPDVAQTLSLAVAACRHVGRTHPLHCVACENMKGSSTVLKHHVLTHLGESDAEYCRDMFTFPDCMINRVVVPDGGDPLHVETEIYCEWTADRNALKGEPPEDVGFIEWVTNQSARLDRKLMVYNGSHAACAYFGRRQGHTWLDEAVRDPAVERELKGTLDQLAAVVQRRHGFDQESVDAYKRDFWGRVRNARLRDEVARVGRQPRRKLGRHERLIAPAKWAYELGLPRDHILRAIAAALEYRHPGDLQSQELAEQLEHDGLRRTLLDVTGLEDDDPLVREIETTAATD